MDPPSQQLVPVVKTMCYTNTGRPRMPEGASDLLKDYFDNTSRNPSISERAALTTQVQAFKGMEGWTRDHCSRWFSARRKRLPLPGDIATMGHGGAGSASASGSATAVNSSNSLSAKRKKTTGDILYPSLSQRSLSQLEVLYTDSPTATTPIIEIWADRLGAKVLDVNTWVKLRRAKEASASASASNLASASSFTSPEVPQHGELGFAGSAPVSGSAMGAASLPRDTVDYEMKTTASPLLAPSHLPTPAKSTSPETEPPTLPPKFKPHAYYANRVPSSIQMPNAGASDTSSPVLSSTSTHFPTHTLARFPIPPITTLPMPISTSVSASASSTTQFPASASASESESDIEIESGYASNIEIKHEHEPEAGTYAYQPASPLSFASQFPSQPYFAPHAHAHMTAQNTAQPAIPIPAPAPIPSDAMSIGSASVVSQMMRGSRHGDRDVDRGSEEPGISRQYVPPPRPVLHATASVKFDSHATAQGKAQAQAQAPPSPAPSSRIHISPIVHRVLSVPASTSPPRPADDGPKTVAEFTERFAKYERKMVEFLGDVDSGRLRAFGFEPAPPSEGEASTS